MLKDIALEYSDRKASDTKDPGFRLSILANDYKMLALLAGAYLNDKPAPEAEIEIERLDSHWYPGSYAQGSVVYLDQALSAEADLLDGCPYQPSQTENWKCEILPWIEEVHPGVAGERFLAIGMDVLPVASRIDEALEITFQELADTWRRETAMLSSITMKSIHPAYQRIIGMGSRVLPLIFRELESTPGHWFWALTFITGEDPVPPEDAGDIKKMTDAWISFGKGHGYI